MDGSKPKPIDDSHRLDDGAIGHRRALNAILPHLLEGRLADVGCISSKEHTGVILFRAPPQKKKLGKKTCFPFWCSLKTSQKGVPSKPAHLFACGKHIAPELFGRGMVYPDGENPQRKCGTFHPVLSISALVLFRV